MNIDDYATYLIHLAFSLNIIQLTKEFNLNLIPFQFHQRLLTNRILIILFFIRKIRRQRIKYTCVYQLANIYLYLYIK